MEFFFFFYRIDAGNCINFEGFYNATVGNASSPDSDGPSLYPA